MPPHDGMQPSILNALRANIDVSSDRVVGVAAIGFAKRADQHHRMTLVSSGTYSRAARELSQQFADAAPRHAPAILHAPMAQRRNEDRNTLHVVAQ
jgi:hypothetical protein